MDTTLLHEAADHGFLAPLQLLLALAPPGEVAVPSNIGESLMSVLHRAARSTCADKTKSAAVAKLLVAEDPSVATLMDGEGWTPVEWAVAFDNTPVLER